MHNDPAVLIDPDGTVKNGWLNEMYHSMALDTRLSDHLAIWKLENIPSDGFHYVITLEREKIGWTKDRPMKLRIGEAIRGTTPPLWVMEDDPVRTLGKNECSPCEFGWLMP